MGQPICWQTKTAASARVIAVPGNGSCRPRLSSIAFCVADVTPLGAGHLIREMKVFNEKEIATISTAGARAGKV
jgi:hypothetical protein